MPDKDNVLYLFYMHGVWGGVCGGVCARACACMHAHLCGGTHARVPQKPEEDTGSSTLILHAVPMR